MVDASPIAVEAGEEDIAIEDVVGLSALMLMLMLLLILVDSIVPIDDVPEEGGANDTMFPLTAPGTLMLPVTELRSVQLVSL